MAKHARRAGKQNAEVVEKCLENHKIFTRDIDDELRVHEQRVYGQLVVWSHMTEKAENRILPPDPTVNYFRSAGLVKHQKETYYLYIWSERIYISSLRDRSKVIFCFLSDIELLESSDDLVPLGRGKASSYYMIHTVFIQYSCCMIQTVFN